MCSGASEITPSKRKSTPSKRKNTPIKRLEPATLSFGGDFTVTPLPSNSSAANAVAAEDQSPIVDNVNEPKISFLEYRLLQDVSRKSDKTINLLTEQVDLSRKIATSLDKIAELLKIRTIPRENEDSSVLILNRQPLVRIEDVLGDLKWNKPKYKKDLQKQLTDLTLDLASRVFYGDDILEKSNVFRVRIYIHN